MKKLTRQEESKPIHLFRGGRNATGPSFFCVYSISLGAIQLPLQFRADKVHHFTKPNFCEVYFQKQPSSATDLLNIFLQIKQLTSVSRVRAGNSVITFQVPVVHSHLYCYRVHSLPNCGLPKRPLQE